MHRGKQGKNKSKVGNVDAMIVASHHAAGRGDVNFPSSDLSRKQPGWVLNQSPPPNFLNKIVWMQETTEATFSQLAAGGFNESPNFFNLSSLPGTSRIAALFDQYCIYSVVVRLIPELGTTAIGTANGTLGQIISAIDYDSSNGLGSFTAYQAYGSAQETECVLGKSYERYVKPVCAIVTGGSNATTNSGVAMARQWVNTAYPGVPHFGVRFAVQGNTTGISVVYRILYTLVVGLRNNI